MKFELSSNTRAILLLTAPLIAGRGKHKPSVKPLGAGEYRQLARQLRDLQRQPADLLAPGAREIVDECRTGLDPERLKRLLGRGFLLAQAVERWQARAIWVLSRADADYPRRLKKRLGEQAPPVLYGCGEAAILNGGGLAVVGSRDVPNALIGYAENVGRLAAEAGCGLISGGARGVDQAGMRGALNAGGRVVGVLADSLEKAAMLREHREALMDGRLVLASPYDPAVRFQVGHAMQRNKLIYALSDAALVVNSDCGKGGTWAGATEQLDKLKFVPIYVRANGEAARGLEELRTRGAKPWPDPITSDAFEQVLDATQNEEQGASAGQPAAALAPADELFAKVEELMERMNDPITEGNIAEALQVSKKQADTWLRRFVEGRIRELFKDTHACKAEAEVAELLQVSMKYARSCLRRLVAEGTLEKVYGPLRYRSCGPSEDLFSLDAGSH